MNYEIKGLDDWKNHLDGGNQWKGVEEQMTEEFQKMMKEIEPYNVFPKEYVEDWANGILAQHGETDLEWAREFSREFWTGISRVEIPLYEFKKLNNER